ncbi:glucan 1,4-alpha-glucosidase [Asticcacaulis biprosthecium C19]|uniref:Glucan 1,4-alpha-glucosidase n=1 Tax=Asticcacaulis biprosthecium C19 TaxID=715226 RepID=F4QJ81_9CAUL|nr:glucan 1,4-alpha-glucosidase [Asticcacaulis biprosthecium]EGF91912.1 glucan 1,4-alpha-glucosidase [Asticcacaulis biprosthecium C19]
MSKRISSWWAAAVSLIALTAAGFAAPGFAAEDEVIPNHNPTLNAGGKATDGPGKPSPWAYAAKTGIGTSYEAYKNFQFTDKAATGKVSKVWFSLADGIVTETMYGLIHHAQIREMQIAVTGDGWTAFEKTDTTSQIAYIHTDKDGRPLSPAYRLTNTDKQGRFVIIKEIFTDPDHQTLVTRVTVKALKGPVTPWVVLDPSAANTSGDDEGKANVDVLSAWQGKVALAMTASVPFKKASVGYTGVTDGLKDLSNHQQLFALHSTAEHKGNIVLLGQLPVVTKSSTFDLFVGFGADADAAFDEAQATRKTGYAKTLANYNGTGAAIGWEDYLASLSELKSLVPVSEDNGKLLYASALTLKVQEDKTKAGGLIASLSNPWGDTVYTDVSATGYKGVWPRDFYQVAMAMAALGDRETPVAAYRYLPTVQVTKDTPGNTGATGWFLQKAHVDGTPEWVGIQLDQTAMPILLGARLAELNLISKDELLSSYSSMLKPAAEFLSRGGTIGLDWNHATITPPYAQQERWEEQEGHSPSTTAALIAGLAAAADIATEAGDTAGAAEFSAKAADYSQKLEQRLFTTSGKIRGADKPASYYLRISRSDDANNPGVQDERNGRAGLASDLMVDQGFIELVRYGVRKADDAHIVQSLTIIDDQNLPENLRVRYDFKFAGSDVAVPGFRRYGNDGYGDRTEGGNYSVNGQMHPSQRGRIWPIFTGERGHYDLAVAAMKPGGATQGDVDAIRGVYVKGMELFANDGLMIPEQVFDGIGSNQPHNYVLGEGIDGATPLAWSHAEYVKLLRSLRDKQVWDRSPSAYAKFAGQQ